MSRIQRGVVALLASVMCLVALPGGASAAPRSPQECAASLDCGAEDINLMSMSERIEFVRAMSSGPAAELLPEHDPYRWRNIEGIISVFRDRGLGAPGSWISYVDSGIVEGIERGLGIATGRSDETGGNPGARLWAEYLLRLRDGELTERAEHDRAWSVAEQASTEYGVYLSEQVHGEPPNPTDERVYQFSEFYRWLLRNRPAAFDLLTGLGPRINPEMARAKVPFYDWFTDVTKPEPTRKGGHMAVDFANFNVLGGGANAVDLFLAYLPALFEEFKADTGWR
ncbi:MAG: hypothetical protein GEU98_26195 [Pseudonocardiaceae bacterium]|nr:hypothetical protein [Pseudonocardiaceae bacterium]